MLPHDIDAAIGLGRPPAVLAMLASGLFVGLTPRACLAGPAVLGYIHVGAEGRRGALLWRAVAYVVGASRPLAALGLLLGVFGDVAVGILAEQAALWYLLVALVAAV